MIRQAVSPPNEVADDVCAIQLSDVHGGQLVDEIVLKYVGCLRLNLRRPTNRDALRIITRSPSDETCSSLFAVSTSQPMRQLRNYFGAARPLESGCGV